MSFFCKPEDLQNESDVEQKIVWNLLTLATPTGPGHRPSEIKTKADIRKLEIGKGTEKKIYYPDYIVVIHGLPSLVIEVKGPTEELAAATREARLYATEINSKFPTSINPCLYTMVTNGKDTHLYNWDSEEPLCSVAFDLLNPTTPQFVKLISLICRDRLVDSAAALIGKIIKNDYHRPVNFAGGVSVRNEELSPNTFGASLALNYRHLFNPITKEDRKYIVQNAYIASKRRERYVQEIDRVIRAAAPPSVSNAKEIDDTQSPKELTDWFANRQQLEHQILLLIGGVGSGKTTFVDYVEQVALPKEMQKVTQWVHANLNAAPLSKETIYNWTIDEITNGLVESLPSEDFDSIEVLRKIYYADIAKLEKGALSLLKEDPAQYNARLADEILALQKDKLHTAKCIERFVCNDRAKLLVVALDNCDKRGRDEQLLMFQVAQWVQKTFRCLVILPLRDVTYDLHRHEPPLDTALKDLVYRIEPPSFQKVLDARINLALIDLEKQGEPKKRSFGLGGKIRVEYALENLSHYLRSILRSIYEHDALARQLITGIAGRDIRRAMEIFLEFCNSGYIDEAEIMKIIQAEGHYGLPVHIVMRVLLRSNRRFYNGDQSYIKNLFQCVPGDHRPDHFVRIGILSWLYDLRNVNGPNGVRGYHKTETLVSALTSKGHESSRVMEEVLYLIKAMCITPEHQAQDHIDLSDLIALAPAGYVHLDLLNDISYVAACAEDTWINDRNAAEGIIERVAYRGYRYHFTRLTALKNAADIAAYLESRLKDVLPQPAGFLNEGVANRAFSFEVLHRDLRKGFEAMERHGG